MELVGIASIDALKEAIITGSCKEDDLLDWEYGGEISGWLERMGELDLADKLRKEYEKVVDDKGRFSIILKTLSFTPEQIDKLTHGQPVSNPFAKQVDTLETLSQKVSELQRVYQHISDCIVPIGTIALFAENSTPSGWLPCEGQSLPKEFFKGLYLRIGGRWKGDDQSRFALPDLGIHRLNGDLRYCIFTGVFEKVPDKGTVATVSDKTILVNGVSFVMIQVTGGTFKMGSDGFDSKIHNVSLSSYYIGQYPVTQALWKAVMGGANPSDFKGDTLPVESVSWDDCQRFIKNLNSMTGCDFRLPTEAEWEFAARGGMKSKAFVYSGSNALKEVGWYHGNSGKKTHPVGAKLQNELGIYDMSGNVWEWCQDWYDGSYYSNSPSRNPQGPVIGSIRVLRGGGWYDTSGRCTASYRFNNSQGNAISDLGFRLAFACGSK